jgi:ABC-type polar amino acid transport system ATPase subunit
MSLCIETQNLTKRFGSHEVVSGLSIKIEEGERVIFQGPSGVGKSTFLRCLTYLEPFQGGQVRVGDLTLEADMDERRHHRMIVSLRQQLGFVFQFFTLFPHLTVLENLTLGPVKVLGTPPEQARDAALRLLKRVDLEGKSGSYPAMLSGGQQQRIGILRALAMRPKALLLDEPTSSLDPEMKQEVVSVLETLARDGLTLLLVTHEPAVVERLATRVVEFGPGCKVIRDRRS